MANHLLPGGEGEPLPGGIIVIRLAKLSKDASETHEVSEAAFILSSDDEESPLQSLSVWVAELTTAEQGRDLMGEGKAKYRLALYLDVDVVRTFILPAGAPRPCLDVVWDPDDRPGAEGHAGIVGLMRYKNGEKNFYKALRSKLARLARKEILPEL